MDGVVPFPGRNGEKRPTGVGMKNLFISSTIAPCEQCPLVLMSDRKRSGRWEGRVYQKEAWASSKGAGALDVHFPPPTSPRRHAHHALAPIIKVSATTPIGNPILSVHHPPVLTPWPSSSEPRISLTAWMGRVLPGHPLHRIVGLELPFPPPVLRHDRKNLTEWQPPSQGKPEYYIVCPVLPPTLPPRRRIPDTEAIAFRCEKEELQGQPPPLLVDVYQPPIGIYTDALHCLGT